MYGLRDQIRENPECAEAIAAKDCDAIARIMSQGRVRANMSVEIGNGKILEVLGMATGNDFLDIIYTQPAFRYVKPLVEQGRLTIGSPLVQATIQSFVSSQILTAEQAEALCALAYEPDPYTALEVAQALFNDDGTDK